MFCGTQGRSHCQETRKAGSVFKLLRVKAGLSFPLAESLHINIVKCSQKVSWKRAHLTFFDPLFLKLLLQMEHFLPYAGIKILETVLPP